MLKITDRVKPGDSVVVEGVLAGGKVELPDGMKVYPVRFDGHTKPIAVYADFVFELDQRSRVMSEKVGRTPKTAISKNIRYYRKRAGISQKKLAEVLGVSAPLVSYWETDERVPRSDLIAPMATLLGVDANAILAENNDGSETAVKTYYDGEDS